VAATLRSSERWSQYLTHGYEVRSWLTHPPASDRRRGEQKRRTCDDASSTRVEDAHLEGDDSPRDARRGSVAETCPRRRPKPSPRPTPKPTFSQKDAAAATVQAEIQKELRAALGRFAELEAAHPEFKPEKRKVPGKVPDRFFLNHQGRRPAGKPKKSSSGKTRA